MTRKGKYIAIEGVDGTGKTTVSTLLKSRLEDMGRTVQTVNILKDDPVSAQVRALLTNPESVIHPDAEAALYAAAVTNVYRHRIAPLLDQGIDVIADRCHISTWAYQVVPQIQAGNYTPMQIWHAAYGTLRPDVFVMLYTNPDNGLGRCAARDGSLDRLEQRGIAYQHEVQDAYRKYCEEARSTIPLYEFHNDGEISALVSFVESIAVLV